LFKATSCDIFLRYFFDYANESANMKNHKLELTGYRKSYIGNQKSFHIWPLTSISRSNQGRFVDFVLMLLRVLRYEKSQVH
jgi:hypothetical protein